MKSATRRAGLISVAVMSLVAGTTGPARADLPITVQVVSSDSFDGTVTGLNFALGAGVMSTRKDGGQGGGVPEVVLPLLVHTSDVGTTIDLTPSDPADFARLAGFLTNGVNDGLVVGYKPEPTNEKGFRSFTITEAGFFYGDDTGANGIDLSGHTLNRIALEVDYLRFTPGDDGSGNPITVVDFAGKLEFFGDPVAVPEPSNLLFGGIAGLTGIGYAWRRRRARLAA